MGASPVIVLNDVTKVYEIGKTRLKALDRINLEVMPGEFCLIVGRSGSGKSTLLNMLAGLERPTSGRIVVAGRHIERMTEKKLVSFRLANIGFVFQSFNLFAAHTAIENVAMPLMYRGMNRRRRTILAKDMLEAVGLSSHADHLPGQMSGGQQQRIAIARALVTKPRILFADEPTGNLDTVAGAEIMNLFSKINKEKGITILQVTHSHKCAAYGDRVVELVNGMTNIQNNNE